MVQSQNTGMQVKIYTNYCRSPFELALVASNGKSGEILRLLSFRKVNQESTLLDLMKESGAVKTPFIINPVDYIYSVF